jgi:hypothetical protein
MYSAVMSGLSGLANHLRERSFEGSFAMLFLAMIWVLLETAGGRWAAAR